VITDRRRVCVAVRSARLLVFGPVMRPPRYLEKRSAVRWTNAAR
jgi:hypothetical protein